MLSAMLQLSRPLAKKGTRHKLQRTPKRNKAYRSLKEEVLKLLIDQSRGCVFGTDVSHYAMWAVFEQVRDSGDHFPIAFWSRALPLG